MTTAKLLHLFKGNNTKNTDRINVNADFKAKYGDISLEEAFYSHYLPKINKYAERRKKIDAFEDYLISIEAPCQESKVSESRYYQFQGMKYRFSSHVYPTGSMTNDFTIDLCAEPELIDSINF